MGSITEPLAFPGSARCVGFRIPPQDDPLAGELVERDARRRPGWVPRTPAPGCLPSAAASHSPRRLSIVASGHHVAPTRHIEPEPRAMIPSRARRRDTLPTEPRPELRPPFSPASRVRWLPAGYSRPARDGLLPSQGDDDRESPSRAVTARVEVEALLVRGHDALRVDPHRPVPAPELVAPAGLVAGRERIVGVDRVALLHVAAGLEPVLQVAARAEIVERLQHVRAVGSRSGARCGSPVRAASRRHGPGSPRGRRERPDRFRPRPGARGGSGGTPPVSGSPPPRPAPATPPASSSSRPQGAAGARPAPGGRTR